MQKSKRSGWIEEKTIFLRKRALIMINPRTMAGAFNAKVGKVLKQISLFEIHEELNWEILQEFSG